jgi:hypothetical protein
MADPNPTTTSGPPGYASAAPVYLANGWQPFPLPAGQKAPPPSGYTGADAHNITADDVARWVAEHATGNIGLHLQRGIIGIDIDAYNGKHGRETIEQLEERLGPLPATLTSTSRSDGVSRIAFYHVPATREYIADLGSGSGVEIIQWRHRYACVSPSRHPDTGAMYMWSNADGVRVLVAGVTPDLCAVLPDAWVEHLTMRAPEPRPERPKAGTTHALSASNTPIPSSQNGQPESIAQWVCDNLRWGEILTLDGWTHSHDQGDDQHWTRPGKQRGTSAVLHDAGNGPLVVFSTDAATSPLWQHGVRSANGDVVSLSLFAYIAATRHGGDQRDCASYYRTTLNREQAVNMAYSGSRTAHAVLDGDTGDVEAVDLFDDMLVNWSTFWQADHDVAEWLAEPVLAIGRSHTIYAAGGTGKSLLTLWLCARIATGGPGLDGIPLQRRHVLYMDYEMTAADLAERLEAFGYGPDDDLSWLHYALLPIIDPADTEAGGQTIARLAEHVQAEIVVIDTYSRSVSGEENSADTVRARYRHTGLHLKAAGVALVWISHAGKDGDKGQRGSSAANDDVDVVWHLAVADDGFVLKAKKRRMGWVPMDVALRQDDAGGELCYRTALAAVPAGTAAVIAKLDSLGAPVDISARKAAQMLRDAGAKSRNEVVRAAVKSRARDAFMGAKSAPQMRGAPQSGRGAGRGGARSDSGDITPGQSVASAPGAPGAHPEHLPRPSGAPRSGARGRMAGSDGDVDPVDNQVPDLEF